MIPPPKEFSDIDCLPYLIDEPKETMAHYHVHELDIFDKDAKEAIFVDTQTHGEIHVQLYDHEPHDEEMTTNYPHGTGYNFIYRLQGLGLFGLVVSSTPLKFDRLI